MKDYKEVVAERYDQEQDTTQSIYAPDQPVGKYTREVLFGGLNAFLRWYRSVPTAIGRGDLADKRLLDVGCGSGEMLDFFIKSGFPAAHALGLDLSETRINKARQRFPEATFVCADGVDFDLGRSFDLITTFDVLSHLPTKEEILQSLGTIARHLDENGLFLWYDIYSEDHFASPEHADSWGFSKQQMIDLAHEAGFEPVYYKTFFRLFLSRYHSAYQVRRFPVWLIRLLEKVLPGIPGNSLLVLKKRT